MSRSRSRHLAAIGLFVLVAFAVRSVSLDTQSLWRDEVDALRFATAPRTELLSTFTRPGWNGPLYFLLLRGWVALSGTTEYAMRFFSLAFGILCLPLAYAVGRRLFNRRVALLTVLLLAVSPYLTWYSQEVKMYTLVAALALLAIYALRRAIAGGGWQWWATQIAATTLAFYAHILAALLVPVQALLCLAWRPLVRRRWVGALVSLACLTLPYVPLAIWQVPLVLEARETGFHHYALGEMVEILLNGWSLGIASWGRPWGAVLMGALAGWGLLSPLVRCAAQAWGRNSRQHDLCLPLAGGAGERLEAFPRKKRLENRFGLICWLVAPLLAVWLISLRQPLFTDRYLIWSAPAFYLLAALGLASVWRFESWGRPAALLLVSVLLVFNGINLCQQATVPIKSDFRAAAAYVAEHYTSGELLLFQIPYGEHTFDYYFPNDEYPSAEGLYTNHRAPDGEYTMSEREAAWHMGEMTAGYTGVWLIATETRMWDERGLVRVWMEENAQRLDEAQFAQVDVYRYVK